MDGLLDAAQRPSATEPSARLVALICPHAGYVYSGPVAASAYRQLRAGQFSRVVICSPSHRVAFRGLALPDVDAFETPLGRVPLWSRCRALAQQPPFILDSRPHAAEHAIEVHLPFLQRTLGDFELVPIVFGTTERIADPTPLFPLLDDDTLLIVSTDLSHYLPYDAAVRRDAQTLDAIINRDAERASQAEACGRGPLAMLLSLARQKAWCVELLDYRNSGDTSGDKSRVVGYAAARVVQADETAG